MTDQPSTQELRELAAEVNRKQNELLAERKRLGLKPGEPLLGLHLDEGPSTTQEAEKALETLKARLDRGYSGTAEYAALRSLRTQHTEMREALEAHHANVWANCAVCKSAVGTQRPPKDDLRGLWPTDAVPGAAHVHYATEPEETP